MYTCIICRFQAELDDVIAPAVGGRCVCLRCFARETGSGSPMPQRLRRDLVNALDSIRTPGA